MRQSIASCLLVVIAVLQGVAPVGMVRADEPAGKFQVHDVSLWILENAATLANARGLYPSAMPATINSVRNTPQPNPGAPGGVAMVRNANGGVTLVSGQGPATIAAPRGRRQAPVGLITFWGDPATNLDVDLRIKSGSFLAHWPPAESLPNRLRWSGGPRVDLVPRADDELQLTTVDDAHWFRGARELQSLFVRRGARAERFLAYDAELNLASPIKLSGGPDQYTIVNTSSTTLYDVVISRNTPQGRRVAWLDKLPKSELARPASPVGTGKNAEAKKPSLDLFGGAKGTPKADKDAATKADDKKPGQVDKPKEDGGAALAATLAAKGFLSKAQAMKAAEAAAGKAQGNKDAAAGPQLVGVEITLSDPLPPDSDEAAAQSTRGLADRLVRAGLDAHEAKFTVDRLASLLFEGEALVVACRLDAGTIDEKMPLSIFPEPSKILRVPLVVMRNSDPQLGGEVDRLVTELGDAKFKVREAAQQRLIELGPLAFPALTKALNHADLEIVIRAERILLTQNQQAVGRQGSTNSPAASITSPPAGFAK